MQSATAAVLSPNVRPNPTSTSTPIPTMRTSPRMHDIVGSGLSRVEQEASSREQAIFNAYRRLARARAYVERVGFLVEPTIISSSTGKQARQLVISVIELDWAWEQVRKECVPSAFHVRVFNKYVLRDIPRGRILKQCHLTGDELTWILQGVCRELVGLICG
jgi:hypothetical protein